jgi:hypothetical protein
MPGSSSLMPCAPHGVRGFEDDVKIISECELKHHKITKK